MTAWQLCIGIAGGLWLFLLSFVLVAFALGLISVSVEKRGR